MGSAFGRVSSGVTVGVRVSLLDRDEVQRGDPLRFFHVPVDYKIVVQSPVVAVQ